MDPAELREAAKSLLRPAPAELSTVVHRDIHIPSAHWLFLSCLLGHVEDRGLYAEFGFRSVRSWADKELDLDSQDVQEALRLWRVVCGSGMAVEAFLPVGKGKMRVVARALALGGSPARWIALATQEGMTEAGLREELQRQLGKEVWLSRTVHAPAECWELIDAALILAVVEIFPEDGGPMTQEQARAIIDDRRWTFRLLEVLAKSYVERVAR